MNEHRIEGAQAVALLPALERLGQLGAQRARLASEMDRLNAAIVEVVGGVVGAEVPADAAIEVVDGGALVVRWGEAGA